jgi:hypothetical protein
MADVITDTGCMADGSRIQASSLNIADKLYLTNEAGGDAVTGDVLALDTANDRSFIFGSTATPYSPAFVVPSDIGTDGLAVAKTITSGDPGWVFKPYGYVPLANVSAAVGIAEYLDFSAVSKNFVGTGITSDAGIPPTSAKAIALNSSVGAGQIPVWLLPPRPWLCHSCRVYNDADENITASVILPVTYNSTDYDPFGMHDAAGTDSKIIIPATLSGTAPFLISGMCKIFDAGGCVAAYIGLRVDGTDVIAHQCANGNASVTLEAIANLTAGQYVEMIAYTTSVGAFVDQGPRFAPELAVTQIGGAYLG